MTIVIILLSYVLSLGMDVATFKAQNDTPGVEFVISDDTNP